MNNKSKYETYSINNNKKKKNNYFDDSRWHKYVDNKK